MPNRVTDIEIARFGPPPDPETSANDTAGEAGAERNSPLRIIDKRLTDLLAPLIKEHPIDPNVITVVSTALVSLTALVEALADEDQTMHSGKFFRMLGMVGGATGDKLDGVVARILENNGVERDKNLGQLLDALADRVQELFIGLAHIIQSAKSEDQHRMVVATLAAMTNNLPSLARAWSVGEKGVAPPEAGRGAIGFFGTRAGRVLSGNAGLFFPKIKLGENHQLKLQLILDLLTFVANLSTAYDRIKKAVDPESEKKASPHDRELAKTRFRALLVSAVISVVAPATLTAYLLHQKHIS